MANWRKRWGSAAMGACLALVASTASAALTWDPSDFIVKKLQVFRDGRVWVHLDKNVSTGGACLNTSKVLITSTSTADGRELMMKVLVAAQLSGRIIEIRIDTEDSKCTLHEVTMN